MIRRALSKYLESLFGESAHIKLALVSGGTLFAIEAAALLLSGLTERTFFLHGGVGVFQTANWVVVAGDWALFVLIFQLTRQLWNLPETFPLNKDGGSLTYLECRKSELLKLILLKSDVRSKLLLAAFSGVGFLFFLYNYQRMSHPQQYFNFALFDAAYHRMGFITVRFILLVSWVFLLPYLAHVSFTTLVVIRRIMNDVEKSDDLRLHYNFLHPDKHGGFSALSAVNVYLLLCLLILFLELISETLTVPIMTLPVKIMLCAVTAIFLWLTFWFMRPIDRFLRETKRKAESSLKEIPFQLDGQDEASTNSLVRYNHIVNNLKFSTNTIWSAVAINAVRALSILGTAYKLANFHTS